MRNHRSLDRHRCGGRGRGRRWWAAGVGAGHPHRRRSTRWRRGSAGHGGAAGRRSSSLGPPRRARARSSAAGAQPWSPRTIAIHCGHPAATRNGSAPPGRAPSRPAPRRGRPPRLRPARLSPARPGAARPARRAAARRGTALRVTVPPPAHRGTRTPGACQIPVTGAKSQLQLRFRPVSWPELLRSRRRRTAKPIDRQGRARGGAARGGGARGRAARGDRGARGGAARGREAGRRAAPGRAGRGRGGLFALASAAGMSVAAARACARASATRVEEARAAQQRRPGPRAGRVNVSALQALVGSLTLGRLRGVGQRRGRGAGAERGT